MNWYNNAANQSDLFDIVGTLYSKVTKKYSASEQSAVGGITSGDVEKIYNLYLDVATKLKQKVKFISSKQSNNFFIDDPFIQTIYLIMKGFKSIDEFNKAPDSRYDIKLRDKIWMVLNTIDDTIQTMIATSNKYEKYEEPWAYQELIPASASQQVVSPVQNISLTPKASMFQNKNILIIGAAAIIALVLFMRKK